MNFRHYGTHLPAVVKVQSGNRTDRTAGHSVRTKSLNQEGRMMLSRVDYQAATETVAKCLLFSIADVQMPGLGGE